MEHVCPQRIVELFCDEYTAQEEGRAAVVAWIDTLDFNVGDTLMLPTAGGGWERWKKEGYTRNKVN